MPDDENTGNVIVCIIVTRRGGTEAYFSVKPRQPIRNDEAKRKHKKGKIDQSCCKLNSCPAPGRVSLLYDPEHTSVCHHGLAILSVSAPPCRMGRKELDTSSGTVGLIPRVVVAVAC